MKFAHYAVCGMFLTLAAAAQTATPPPTPPAASPAAPAQSAPPMTPGGPPKLSTLGGDAVKGPEHPLTPEQAKELYIAMGYQKNLEDNRAQQMAAQKARAPFIPQDVWDDFDATSAKVDYPTAFYDVYKKYISTEDATKLIEFAKTPAGKAFFDNSPALNRETVQAIQKQQQSVGAEVQARHKDEIEAAVKKYREEHAPKPAPSLGPTTGPTPGSPTGAATPSGATPSPTPAPAAPPATTPPPATPPSTTPQHQ
jgi:hypothetical protein